MTRPVDPAVLTTPETYGFGDAVRSQDQRVVARALDVLEPRYHDVRVLVREMPAATAPDKLRADVAAVLERDGWAALPELTPTNGDGFTFGWHKDTSVYAIVGLERAGGADKVPVNILTNTAGD